MDFGVKLMSQLGGVVSSDVVQWLVQWSGSEWVTDSLYPLPGPFLVQKLQVSPTYCRRLVTWKAIRFGPANY